MLSIIIPTFNTCDRTLRCCRAALAALPAGGEVIVVDDASTDGTAEALRDALPDVRIIVNERNSGYAVSINRGAAAARGDILLFLNSDADVERGSLERFVEAFEDDAKLGVAGAELQNPDGTPQWSGGRTPTMLWLIVLASGAAAFWRRRRKPSKESDPDWVTGAAMAVRRETWDAVGPLSEKYRFYAQDLELCLKARAAGRRVSIAKGAIVRHDLGGTIASGSESHNDPALLWSDLLTWAEGHYGPPWARRARFAMRLAARVRIVWRRLSGKNSDAYVRALRAISDS